MRKLTKLERKLLKMVKKDSKRSCEHCDDENYEPAKVWNETADGVALDFLEEIGLLTNSRCDQLDDVTHFSLTPEGKFALKSGIVEL